MEARCSFRVLEGEPIALFFLSPLGSTATGCALRPAAAAGPGGRSSSRTELSLFGRGSRLSICAKVQSPTRYSLEDSSPTRRPELGRRARDLSPQPPSRLSSSTRSPARCSRSALRLLARRARCAGCPVRDLAQLRRLPRGPRGRAWTVRREGGPAEPERRPSAAAGLVLAAVNAHRPSGG